MNEPTVTGDDKIELPSDPLADARLAAIVESSFDAIISKDLNSIIQTWNPAATKLFGYTAAEAVGRPITMLIPDYLQSEEGVIIGRIRRGERVESYETVRQRKDGSRIYLSITVSPIKDSNGVIVGASKVARDISQTRENERRIRLLLREINHRVKNQFAVINSIIRESVKASPQPAEFEVRVRNRILALARSHDLLVASEWKGASLADLASEQLAPYGHEDRITISGLPVQLSPSAVQNIGMAFHELGTNSAKYGALCAGDGSISVLWDIEASESGDMLVLRWEEEIPSYAGESAAASTRKGFGSVVLLRVTPQSLGGTATLERLPGKITWTLQCPLANILDGEDDEAHDAAAMLI